MVIKLKDNPSLRLGMKTEGLEYMEGRYGIDDPLWMKNAESGEWSNDRAEALEWASEDEAINWLGAAHNACAFHPSEKLWLVIGDLEMPLNLERVKARAKQLKEIWLAQKAELKAQKEERKQARAALRSAARAAKSPIVILSETPGVPVETVDPVAAVLESGLPVVLVELETQSPLGSAAPGSGSQGSADVTDTLETPGVPVAEATATRVVTAEKVALDVNYEEDPNGALLANLLG